MSISHSTYQTRPMSASSSTQKFVTQWSVSRVPESHPQAHMWTIVVERRRQMDGAYSWTVRLPAQRMWMNDQGGWDPPCAGDEHWVEAHRFDNVQTALTLAERAAPVIEYGGVRARDVKA